MRTGRLALRPDLRGASIRTRLLTLVLVILIPTGLVVGFVDAAWRDAAQRDAAAGVTRLAEAAAVHQENLLSSTALLLEVMAASEPVASRSQCSSALRRIHQDLPQYGVMGVADADGDFWCSSIASEGPISVADRDYFIETRRTRAPAVGHYQIGRVTGKPTVALAHPLLGPNEEFLGAVIASIDLSRPASLAERVDLPRDSALTVFDGQGTVLMRWPDPEGFVGQRMPEQLASHRAPGNPRLQGLDGVERIYGAAELAHGGELLLTVGVPAGVIDAAADRGLRWAWAGMLAIALLAAAVALYMGRMLVAAPIARLIGTAKRLGAGDLSARTEMPRGGEIAELAREFDTMAVALQQREDELREAQQRAVEQRYQGLLDVAADAVVVADSHGRIKLFNRGAEAMFGLTMAEVQGSGVRDLLGPVEVGDERREVQWTDAAGMPRWAEATASLGSDGLTTIILRDVTSAHEAAVVAAALRESDARFRLAQQYSSIGLALVALDGRWLDVNPALCRIVGRTPEELLTLTFQDITHPDDLESDLAQVDRLLAGDSDGYEIEKRYKHADGHDVWIQLNGSVVRDSDGRPQYFVAQVQDITERKRSQGLLDLFFKASPDLLAVADDSGFFVEVNPAWTSQLGWAEEELLSQPFTAFVHPDDLATTITEHQALSSGSPGTQRFENRYRAEDGSYRWLQWNSLRLADMGLTVANARDVTTEREQQALLDRHRQDLERSNAELEQFAYVASHDLSEPLRAISGFGALLKEELDEDLSETAEEYLRFIVEGTTRMQALINDLLAFSRVSRTAVKDGPVALSTIAAEVTASLLAAPGNESATIDVGPLPDVMANASMMRQLLQNLAANALKFRESESESQVRIRLCGTEAGWAEIAVEDNGIGIEPRHRERVFRMFQRLHTRSEYAGTGMGLAICSKIVETLGGRIWIADSSLGGAAFHLTLPLPKEPKEHKEQR